MATGTGDTRNFQGSKLDPSPHPYHQTCHQFYEGPSFLDFQLPHFSKPGASKVDGQKSRNLPNSDEFDRVGWVGQVVRVGRIGQDGRVVQDGRIGQVSRVDWNGRVTLDTRAGQVKRCGRDGQVDLVSRVSRVGLVGRRVW